jgi:hypothetical protein
MSRVPAQFPDGQRACPAASAEVWRPSYLGSGTTLERAQAVAQANYQRLRTATGWEQGVNERKIF